MSLPALTNGLNITLQAALLTANNATAQIAVIDPPFNNTQEFDGLTANPNTSFVDYNPLGFRRAFAFTQGLNLNQAGLYSKAGAVLTPQEQAIVQMQTRTGIYSYVRELANQNNYTIVPANPYYTPPGNLTGEILTDTTNQAITDISNNPIVSPT